MDQFKVHIQGGALELLIPVPDPMLSISWLKEEFRSRAEKRGKSVIVDELSFNGYLVDDVDSIWDVLSDECRLVAIGPGIEPPPGRSSGIDESGRTKRKYTRGGHKKLKVVAHVLEAHLPEMMQTAEKERQRFYAKMVALPQMMAADVNRDEIVSWYKRARKKSRGGDEDEDLNDDNNINNNHNNHNHNLHQETNHEHNNPEHQFSTRNMSGGQQYYQNVSSNPMLNNNQSTSEGVLQDWKLDHQPLINSSNLEYNSMEVYGSLDSHQSMMSSSSNLPISSSSHNPSSSSSSSSSSHNNNSDHVHDYVDYSTDYSQPYDYVPTVDYNVVGDFQSNPHNGQQINGNSQMQQIHDPPYNMAYPSHNNQIIQIQPQQPSSLTMHNQIDQEYSSTISSSSADPSNHQYQPSDYQLQGSTSTTSNETPSSSTLDYQPPHLEYNIPVHQYPSLPQASSSSSSAPLSNSDNNSSTSSSNSLSVATVSTVSTGVSEVVHHSSDYQAPSVDYTSHEYLPMEYQQHSSEYNNQAQQHQSSHQSSRGVVYDQYAQSDQEVNDYNSRYHQSGTDYAYQQQHHQQLSNGYSSFSGMSEYHQPPQSQEDATGHVDSQNFSSHQKILEQEQGSFVQPSQIEQVDDLRTTSNNGKLQNQEVSKSLEDTKTSDVPVEQMAAPTPACPEVSGDPTAVCTYVGTESSHPERANSPTQPIVSTAPLAPVSSPSPPPPTSQVITTTDSKSATDTATPNCSSSQADLTSAPAPKPITGQYSQLQSYLQHGEKSSNIEARSNCSESGAVTSAGPSSTSTGELELLMQVAEEMSSKQRE